MNNFYCGLHILVNFAELADTTIRQLEERTKEGPLGAESHNETKRFCKPEKESGSIRLIRTTAKCLARGGDEKSGCFGDFRTFITEKDEEEQYKGKPRASLLVPFRGNRFNILFYDAEVTYFLAAFIQDKKIENPVLPPF